jgi:tRNA(Ile)-lysidine synthase
VPELASKIREFIFQNAMPSPKNRVLVAVSGGADSVALLRILFELGYPLEIAHCNFGLRDESDDDERFVAALSADLGLNCHFRRFSKIDFESDRGEGTQQIARKLRYAFFEELMNALEISHCAIAHHADDQLETMIQTFFRGNGPVILRGMPLQRGPYFRPLLSTPKSELVAWLEARKQIWRHDLSNDKDDYRRNLVRNRLIPVLKALNPDFPKRFRQQSDRHSAHWDLLQDIFEPLAKKVVTEFPDRQVISIKVFAEHMNRRHFPVFLDWWLMRLGCSGTEIAEIQRLLGGEVGSTYKGVVVEVLHDRDQLRIRNSDLRDSIAEIELSKEQCDGQSWEFAGSTLQSSIGVFPEVREPKGGPETHWLALDQLEFPLKLRPWRIGDRMQPLGMKGSKLISDILIDQKRDRFSKESAWVIEDGKGIVLLGGFRIADRVAASPAQPCWRLEVRPSM